MEVDYDTLENLFFQKQEDIDKINALAKAAANNQPTQIMILENKKVGNTSIVLKSFTKTVHEIIDSLTFCNDILSIEQLQKILSMVPTDEEIKKLNEYTDNINLLTDAEKFLLKLIKVPKAKNRIESMIFKKNFESEYSEYVEKLNNMHSPFSFLKVDSLFYQK